jgi:hypothetical protein
MNIPKKKQLIKFLIGEVVLKRSYPSEEPSLLANTALQRGSPASTLLGVSFSRSLDT